MTHIWWESEVREVREYWQEVQQYIKEITKEEVMDDPWSCLFHNTNKTIKQYTNTLVPYLLNAAKGVNSKKMARPRKTFSKGMI